MTGGAEFGTRDAAPAMTAQARVTFVISGLVVGGAERVLTAIANHWVEAGRPVTIVTLDKPDEPPFFPVDQRVELRRLGLASVSHHRIAAVANNIRRIVYLRRAIACSRPDVVVSFMDRTNVLTLLATLGGRWPVIVADRSAEDPRSGRIWLTLRRITYRRARWIVVQTQNSHRALPGYLRRHAVAVPNPVLAQPAPMRAATGEGSVPGALTPDPNLVVALGRLVPQKGFDLLIEAFACAIRRAPAARLEIWGAGPQEAILQALVARHGLAGRVILPGETRDPAAAIARAGVFVLSSRVEGFPNVLLEAMALGRPVVAVDCAFGPGEIVRDGIDGRLVPAGNTGALVDAIVEMLASPAVAAVLGAKAIEVRDRFAFEPIVARWSSLVDGAAYARRR